MRTHYPLVILLLLAPLADAAEFADLAEFVLVDVNSGVAPAPLILFPDAPQKTREAAVELADYVEASCGVRPRLMDGIDKAPSRAVWIGYQPKLKELFPKLDFEFQFLAYLDRRLGSPPGDCRARPLGPSALGRGGNR